MATIEQQLNHIFMALSDKTRRDILCRLLHENLTVTDIATPLSISLVAVSKHIKVLLDANLIEQRRSGRKKWCMLKVNSLMSAITWIESFGTLNVLDLDKLESLLDKSLNGH